MTPGGWAGGRLKWATGRNAWWCPLAFVAGAPAPPSPLRRCLHCHCRCCCYCLLVLLPLLLLMLLPLLLLPHAAAGESESSLKGIFAAATALAPSVVIIDEVDALAPARGGGGWRVEWVSRWTGGWRALCA